MHTGRALWEARWLRTVAVFSLTATAALLAVPPVLRQATEREEARGLAVWVGTQDPGPLITHVATAAAADQYWVQVGVFRDGEAAKRVAQRLRERKYQVHESIVQQRSGTPLTAAATAVPTRGTDTRYEVVVSGGASSEVAARVATKGLSGRPSPEGVVITPSLPLSEAVALSRDLADDGLTVKVRRVGAAAAPAPRAEDIQAGAASGTDTLHRVRVGGFADRAAAEAVLRELEALGYKPFLARGRE